MKIFVVEIRKRRIALAIQCINLLVLITMFPWGIADGEDLEKSKMDMKKPWYTVKIEACGVPYELRINDCPIMTEERGSGGVAELPINQWVVSGDNRLKLILHRLDDTGGEFIVTVQVKDMDMKESQSMPIAVLKAEAQPFVNPGGTRKADKTQNAREAVTELTFIASVPFPKWAWMDVDSIDLTDIDRKEIVKCAKDLWQAFKNKNMEHVIELLSLKIKETAIATYQTENERTAELQRTYENAINNPEWYVEEFFDTDLEYRRYANGKLYLLIDMGTGDSPLLFADKGDKFAQYVKLYFFKDEKGDWRIIR